MLDMRIDQKKIKKMRLARAWTQAEVADMTDLSLRTIQRIENAGFASLESLKALAAVFETESASLVKKSRKPQFFAASLGVVLLCGLLIILPASANPIMLKLKMSDANQVLADVQLLNNGDVSELQIDQNLKLMFTAEQTAEDKIKVSVQIFRLSGEQMSLVAAPQIITQNKQAAAIHFDGLALAITPEF